jgi:hypothetical protein
LKTVVVRLIFCVIEIERASFGDWCLSHESSIACVSDGRDEWLISKLDHDPDYSLRKCGHLQRRAPFSSTTGASELAFHLLMGGSMRQAERGAITQTTLATQAAMATVQQNYVWADQTAATDMLVSPFVPFVGKSAVRCDNGRPQSCTSQY